MNYGELKQAIAEWSHRTDLAAQMQTFVSNVGQRLGRRFGEMPGALVSDSDTNSILQYHPNIYLYGALREQSIYTHNAEATQAYEALYQGEIKQLNINYTGTDWTSPTPVMGSCPTEETT